MNRKDELRQFFTEARRTAKQAADIKVEFAALRDAATQKGFDWSQIKALAAADVADEEKGDGKRVEKIIAKADFAAAYADMLGLRHEGERKLETRSSKSSRGGMQSLGTRSKQGDVRHVVSGAGLAPGPRETIDADTGEITEPAPAESRSALAVAPAPSTADMRAGAILSDANDGIPNFCDRRAKAVAS